MSSSFSRSGSGSPGVVIAGLVAQLGEVVGQLAELTAEGAWSQVPSAALPELVASIHAGLDRGEALATVATGVLESSGVLAVEGFVTAKRWLQSVCGHSAGQAGAVLGRARDLRCDFPATEQAWLGGEVSSGSVREITTGIKTALVGMGTAEAAANRVVAEGILLQVAKSAGPAQVRRAAARLRLCTDPDGASAAAIAAAEDQ